MENIYNLCVRKNVLVMIIYNDSELELEKLKGEHWVFVSQQIVC